LAKPLRRRASCCSAVLRLGSTAWLFTAKLQMRHP
jgi:hypothetical protein